MATERLKTDVPEGFDPDRHTEALLRRVAEVHGDGWEITNFDSTKNVVHLMRQRGLTEVHASDNKDSFAVTLAKGTKPGDALRVVTRLEDQYTDYSVTKFEPYLGQAELTKLDRATRRARGASANALGVAPWEVEITSRADGGWNIVLPASYVPSKHYDKLVEVAEDIIGTLGWTVEADADNLTASFVPGDPPTFPDLIAYPFDEPVPAWKPGCADDWADIPLGWTLTRRADDRTKVTILDLEASPHSLISGTTGSGKSATINCFIAGVLARGAELVIADLPAKSVDFLWCKDFVRPNGGWGCDSLDAAVVSLALVYEEGQRRGQVLRDHHVTKWTELPPSAQFPPIIVLVDEVTGLLIQEKVPKGLDRDHPLVVEAKTTNTKKAMLESFISKISAELRFVGVKLVLSSQVSSTTTGVSTAIRLNLGNKMLLGTRATPNNRKLALTDPASAPTIPPHIAEDDKAGRGSGVFEFEGQPSGVFKGFFATTAEYRRWLDRRGARTTGSPEPRGKDLSRFLAVLTDDKPTAVAGPAGVHGGGGLSLAAEFSGGEMCTTCDSKVDPLTAECLCTP